MVSGISFVSGEEQQGVRTENIKTIIYSLIQ